MWHDTLDNEFELVQKRIWSPKDPLDAAAWWKANAKANPTTSVQITNWVTCFFMQNFPAHDKLGHNVQLSFDH